MILVRLILAIVFSITCVFVVLLNRQLFEKRRKESILLYLGLDKNEVRYIETTDKDVWEVETPSGRMRAYFVPKKKDIIRVERFVFE